MANRNYPPASLRYLRARLSQFQKPAFWGTGIFLLLVGVGMWQYWLNPNLLTDNQPLAVVNSQPANKDDISDDNKAIAADIDNLPVIINDFSVSSFPDLNITAKKTENNNSNFIEDVINKQNNSNQLAKSSPNIGVSNVKTVNSANTFVLATEELLYTNLNNTDSRFLRTSNIRTSPVQTAVTTVDYLPTGLINQVTNNRISGTSSPLTLEMEQYHQASPIYSNINSAKEINTQIIQTSPNVAGQIYNSNPALSNIQPNPNYPLNNSQTLPNSGISATGNGYGNYNLPNNTYIDQKPRPATVNSSNPGGYGNYNSYGVQQSIPLSQPTYGSYGVQPPITNSPANLPSSGQVPIQYPR
ncbi:hypothetical protein B6N60_03436 [Richelia sinica FACHB-800]|uniref:Uncharacterized protein n=1 Tax=Richelia sinica FACHB-800 TaxID=1357546 RepID=A0A975TB13_9NOST|nr:hypothetical protein [Richelia sinica]MBD2666941.1 hypothetical protein [Richelia sinica FACHB-800]QXE24728.1 hypothetical protein B6N60_03436 [Richelia sinica FACHB-800]